MRDSEIKKKYGELYLHIVHLQRYLETCIIVLEEQGRVRDHFILDDKDLQLLIACLRIIKEDIKEDNYDSNN